MIHIFRDEGISGAKLNEKALEIDRVGLQEMLVHLSSAQTNYVIVMNTGRLAVRYCESADTAKVEEIWL